MNYRFASLFAKVRPLKKDRLKLALTAANALVLVVLTWWLQNSGRVRVDETVFFKWFAIVKHNVLKIDPKPERDSVVFVDVSKDLQLIDDTFPNYGNLAITDRDKLTTLFSALARHTGGYRYLLCDITFDYPSGSDSGLRAAMAHTTHWIASGPFGGADYRANLFGIHSGAINYDLVNKAFIKMQLFQQDTLPSLPVLMAEQLAGKRYQRRKGITYENDHVAFNSVIPELYYRPYDLVRSGGAGKPNLFYLGDLITDDRFFDDYCRNKYIVLGDFSKDVHNTYLGPTPGPLILWNTFLTLKERSVAVSLLWLVMLYFLFFGIGYRIIVRPPDKKGRLTDKVRIRLIREMVATYLSYLGLLLLANLISYLIFGIFFSLLYLATYLLGLEVFIEKRRKYLQSKNLWTFIKDEFA
jgi:hypothetical protein